MVLVPVANNGQFFKITDFIRYIQARVQALPVCCYLKVPLLCLQNAPTNCRDDAPAENAGLPVQEGASKKIRERLRVHS